MAYVPPHKRHSSTSEPAPTPSPPTSSLRPLSIFSPRGRQRHLTPPSNRIIHDADCVSRWSPLPPFSHYAESLCLEPFPCDPIERKTGAKPLVLALSSPSSGSTKEAAAAAITERFLPDLLDAAERATAKAHDVPREEEEAKLSLMARVGKVLFQRLCGGGLPVSLDGDAVRDLAEAGTEGSNSQVRTTFYTNLPSDFLNDMERFAMERMELDFVSTKEHYHVKVFDKQRSDSTMSCKCIVQEDGKLAIDKVELNQIRQLVEDVSCLSKDLDLRLMLNTKRILKKIDPEVENAIKSLVSSAIVDPNARGGLRWPLGNRSIGERFSVAGVWHTNYKAFRNKSFKMYLRHADRFDQGSSTGEVCNEVTFKLAGMSKRLQDGGNPEVDTLKGMLDCAVQMIWDCALSYH